MGANVEALKTLYTALGGSDDVSAINLTSDMIVKIAGIVGGTNLPAVTSEDNGDVLKVVSGEWAKGSVSELPTVSATDNGSVLKVVEGQWAVSAE